MLLFHTYCCDIRSLTRSHDVVSPQSHNNLINHQPTLMTVLILLHPTPTLFPVMARSSDYGSSSSRIPPTKSRRRWMPLSAGCALLRRCRETRSGTKIKCRSGRAGRPQQALIWVRKWAEWRYIYLGYVVESAASAFNATTQCPHAATLVVN